MSIFETAHVATLRIPVPAPDADRTRREVLRVSAVRHPGLCVVDEVAVTRDGVEVTYAVPDLSRPVSPGEQMEMQDALRLIAPVAAALALLHDAGFVHGGVDIDRLWRRPDGGGVLAPGSGHGDPGDDVRDVALLLQALLPERSVGADIAQALIAGADPDTAVRPSMARMAAILDAAVRRAGPPTSPPAHRRVRASAVLPLAAEPTRPDRGGAPAPAGRGRHAVAAPVGRFSIRPSWRLIAVLVGIGGVAYVGLGAIQGGAAPDVCPVTSSAVANVDATSR